MGNHAVEAFTGESPGCPRSSRTKNWRRISGLVLIVIVSVVCLDGSSALKAEERLIAVISPVVLVEDYVKHAGHWPN